MAEEKYIPIVLGTGREGRYSDKVANFVFQEASKQSFKTEVIDVRDYATPVTVPSWAGKIDSQVTGDHDQGRWSDCDYA